jgi:hypothetical protein
LVVLSDGGGGAGGVTLVGRVGVRTAARGRVAAAVAEPTGAVGAAWGPSLRSLTRFRLPQRSCDNAVRPDLPSNPASLVLTSCNGLAGYFMPALTGN